MKKLISILAAFALSSAAVAAKSDDVLQNIPASKTPVVADATNASATGTAPQQEMTPAGPSEKVAKKHHAKKHHAKKHVKHHKAAATKTDTKKDSTTSTPAPADQPAAQ